MKKVVVTGAAGYIGGQTCIELKDNGYEVWGLDRRLIPEHLTKYMDKILVMPVGEAGQICAEADAIIHCAGSSLVGPSMLAPATYYHNNVGQTGLFIEGLVDKGWQGRFVFSSSAAVYGTPKKVPIYENAETDPINPYGRSKLYCEHLLNDSARTYKFTAVTLRYFNAVGADIIGRHGQEPECTHVFARIFESLRDNTVFEIYGDQHETDDGTCVRDYIHVTDIARAHRLSIEKSIPLCVNNIFNLGTETGYSIREIIAAVEQSFGRPVNAQIVNARAGDPAVLVANPRQFQGYFDFDLAHSDLPIIIISLRKWYKI